MSLYSFKADRYSSHATILACAGAGAGRRILDVGAADGFLAQHLSAHGWRVTAIEQDPDAATRARQYCEQVLVCDLNHGAPLLQESFHTIVYGDVLEHLLTPGAVCQALNRHLAEDGDVIISVPNIAHLWIRLMLLLGRFDYADRGILDRTHIHFFTLKTLRQFLGDNHLEPHR